ncbi:MAG: hypothetical protein HY592_00810 [Candidatus Omnitrophica bacterium]|nr:hypothetical protein [Candidatus Omnitrophota bacterium]
MSDIKKIADLSKRWLEKGYPYRKKAIQRLTGRSGFSRAQAEAVIDGIFKDLSQAKMKKLLGRGVKNPPKTILHILPANIPNPAILSFVFGLLTQSRNICKLSRRDEGFLDIYRESLRAHAPHLAAGHLFLSEKSSLRRYYRQADLVIAFGSDRTLAEIQKVLPPRKAFAGYGRQEGIGFYTRSVMTKRNIPSLSKKTAHDIWMMAGRGCHSPAVIYVESGGEVSPRQFSRTLKRPFLVRGFEKRESVFWNLEHLHAALSTVALEALPSERKRLEKRFLKLGAKRICRAGQMQVPPLGLGTVPFWVQITRPRVKRMVK